MDRISWSQAGSAWGQEIEDGIPGDSGSSTLLVDKTCPGLLRGQSFGPCFSGHLRSGDVLHDSAGGFDAFECFITPLHPQQCQQASLQVVVTPHFMNGSAMPRPVEPAVYRHQRHQRYISTQMVELSHGVSQCTI